MSEDSVGVDRNLDSLGELIGAQFTVESVMIPGFIDTDLPSRQARAYPSFVAFGDGEKYLIIEPAYDGDGLCARVSRELGIPKDLSDEPSIEPLYLDTANILVDEFLPVEVASIHAYGDRSKDVGTTTLGMRFEFSNGRVICVRVPASMGMIIGGADVMDGIEDAPAHVIWSRLGELQGPTSSPG